MSTTQDVSDSGATIADRKVTACAVPPIYVARDGRRTIASHARRSEAMRAATPVASHGCELGAVGAEPEFTWSEPLASWIFVGGDR